MSEAISQASCIRHRERVKFFVMYEDFQNIAKGPHAEKIAAFLRILEVKTNEIIIANQVLVKEAEDKRMPQPVISRWIEVSYSDFVRWSLGTVSRSSFQIADKEAEKLLFVKSRVRYRHSKPEDAASPLVPYKEYLLVLENIQATLDGKELPIIGELFEQYGGDTPVRKNIPPCFSQQGGMLGKTHPPVEKNTGGMLGKTHPPVEKNRLEVITNKEKESSSNEEIERESTNVSAPTEAANAAALTRSLLEIENLTSEEVELATRMILEQRRQQTVPPVEEIAASSSIESEQKETGKNDKTATKPTRRKTASKPEASLQAMAILSAWSLIVWGTSDRETPHTKDNLTAAEELARINATENDLRNVRDRLLAQKDGFWKSRGVSLKNIANNFHLAALGPLSSQAAVSSRPVPDTSVPMNHDQACQLAADAAKAAKGQGREIQVQAVSLDNGAWGIVVRWNTTGFEKPETFKIRNRWDGVFKEMCGIWQDETKEKVRKG